MIEAVGNQDRARQVDDRLQDSGTEQGAEVGPLPHWKGLIHLIAGYGHHTQKPHCGNHRQQADVSAKQGFRIDDCAMGPGDSK
ncbi:MAG: hypothetical protein AAEI92_13300 [Arenicellales bacterium]